MSLFLNQMRRRVPRVTTVISLKTVGIEPVFPLAETQLLAENFAITDQAMRHGLDRILRTPSELFAEPENG